MAQRGSPGLAFAVGMGGGYLNAQRQNKLDADRTEDRDMRKQEFDARMGEVNEKKQTRMGLADAARPAAVNENAATLDASGKPVVYEDAGVANSDYRQARTMGLADVKPPSSTFAVNGKSYGTRPEADTAATDYNKPEAMAKRQGDVLRQAGRPGDAMAIEQAQMKFSQEQASYVKKLQDEGVFAGVRAFRSGDAAGMTSALNQGGKFKIEGLELTKEDREIPGAGTVPTYNAKYRKIAPDGTVTEETRNSHDLSMQLMPYEKALELQRKGSDSDNKFTNQMGLLDIKGNQVALQGQLGAARIEAARAKGGGSVGREERLRYTSLFQDAGRRAGEAQKALTALQKDPDFARAVRRDPNGPQAQELAGLRESLKSHAEERTLYQGLLAGSQSPGSGRAPAAPSLADAKPAASALKQIKSAAERDALPKGTKYIAPNGQTYVKQ